MIYKLYQRGALLIAAIVLVVIITAIVTAMSFLSVSNTGASASNLSSTQAFFAANSGLERALFQFSKLDTDCASLSNPAVAIGDGTSSTSPGKFSITGTVYPTAATASTLSGAITSTDTIIPVTSIANFAPHGRILIESEEIDYAEASTDAADCGTAPCFIAEKRGENSTIAAAHANALAVYQPSQCLIRSTGTAGSAERILETVVRDLSVQTGTVAMSTTVQTATYPAFKPVNPNRSFVVCQYNANDSHNGMRPTCELTNSSTITITTGTANAAESVRWYVVEFLSGVTVQRGLQSLAGGTGTANVTLNPAVTLANTFVITSERFNANSDSTDERWTTSAQLTTTTNLQLVRNNTTTNTVSVAWQVIQNNSATVQSNAAVLSIGRAATSITATLSPAVDVTKTFAVVTRRAGSATGGIERYYQTRDELTNTTTLTFTRAFQNNTLNTQVDNFWYAVSMTDGSTVQHGTATPAGTGNTVNAALSPAIVPSRSLPIISVSGDAASATPTGDLDDTSWTPAFTSCTPTCTNLQLVRANASTNANIAWFVAQFAPQISLIDEREIFP